MDVVDHGQLDRKKGTRRNQSNDRAKTSRNDRPIFSSQKISLDYTTLQGIENRIGVKKENIVGLVLKELLDNALDFQEKKHNRSDQHTKKRKGKGKQDRITFNSSDTSVPEIKVTIVKKPNYWQVSVRNSHNDSKTVFSKELLDNIFDFDSFYSSKRNQYKISRGALGDALKEILCIPYAMARNYDIKDWAEPLVITTNNSFVTNKQIFKVYLVLDRVNQTLASRIEEADNKSDDEGEEECLEIDQDPFTEITVRFPFSMQHETNSSFNPSKLRSFLLNYATFNTHIGFTFDLVDETINNGISYHDSLPSVQPLDATWAWILFSKFLVDSSQSPV